MASIKDHLRKIIEVTTSVKMPTRWATFCLAEGNVILKSPISIFGKAWSNEKLDKVLELKPDDVVKGVSYSERDDLLIFALDPQKFISRTLLEPEKISKPLVTTDSKKEQILIDFSSPNIAKPFHMGHLRSTLIGQFVANILGRRHNVTRINYLGDWGTQFGYVQKGLEQMKISEADFQSDPIGVLYKAYVLAYNSPNMLDEAKSIFLRLENDDESCMKDWHTIKAATYEHLRKTYEMLNIRFDEYSCESDYRMSNIHHVIEDLIKRGIARQDGDQLVIDTEKAKVPLLRQNRTTLYITRDIAAALDRINRYRCEKIVYVVDKSQSDHFGVLGDVVNRLGYGDMVKFCPFGRITGMSTSAYLLVSSCCLVDFYKQTSPHYRKGTSVFLSDILEESMQRMAEQQKNSKNTRATDDETVRVLGLTGLQTYILKHGRTRDFNFEWAQALQSTGDSGVKIQYTHSRLKSLEERFAFSASSVEQIEENCFNDPSVLPLVLEMARFDEVIDVATEKLESSIAVAYLFKLCNLSSRALKHVQVKNQEESIGRQRLLLFHKARLKIADCMNVLGLKPLDKM